jgi:predicted acylesterase/phospholipase RssA
MIRALRLKGLSYRAIAELCGCSHGSVHAELVALKKEEQIKKEQLFLAKEEEKKQIAYFEKTKIKDVAELSPQEQTLALPSSNPPTAA